MRLKHLTLGTCMLLANLASASSGTYTVREGDTLSGIAQKLGVSQRALLQANSLESPNNLRIGKKLIVPGTSKTSSGDGGTYSVKSGDNDNVIARKFGLSVRQLHTLNPNVDFEHLQIGVKLKVSGSSSHSTKSTHSSSGDSSASGSSKYTVKSGDNDWIIAKKFGMTAVALHKLNPGVKWSSIQPGDKIKVAGGGSILASSTSSSTKRSSSKGVIAADGVTLRRGPSTDTDKVTTVDAGTPVTILQKKNGWYKLRFPKGTEAWVRGDFVKTSHETVVAKGEVKGDSSVVALYQKKDTSKSSKKSKETKSSGKSGQTKSTSYSASKAEAVLKKAYTYKGVRYSYGGTSRSGIDCSGFTSSVFKSQGIYLPRTALEQSSKGTAVSKSSLKPGDLVFFRTNRSRRINHVGIYIGSGKFIHASSGGGRVMVSSLNEGYYQNRYAGGRRVIKGGSSSPKDEEAVAKDMAPPLEPEAQPIDEPTETPAGNEPKDEGSAHGQLDGDGH